jgi:hypothetical protein
MAVGVGSGATVTAIGAVVGVAVGAGVEAAVGAGGTAVGTAVGVAVGLGLGKTTAAVGVGVGLIVGATVGSGVGATVGSGVGLIVGATVGLGVGATTVGAGVGAAASVDERNSQMPSSDVRTFTTTVVPALPRLDTHGSGEAWPDAPRQSAAATPSLSTMRSPAAVWVLTRKVSTSGSSADARGAVISKTVPAALKP